MKIPINSAVLLMLLTSCMQAPDRHHDLSATDDFIEYSGHIQLGLLDVNIMPYQDVFTLIEERSQRNDPKGKGIQISVPQEYLARYTDEFASRPVTCNLGPNLSMKQLLAEFPLEDWFLRPTGQDTLTLLPLDVLSTNKSGEHAPPAGRGEAPRP